MWLCDNTHVCSTKSSHCPRIWTHLEYQTNILISSTDQNCLLSSDSLLQSAWLIEIQFSSSSMSWCFNWFPQGYSRPHCGLVSGAPLELLKNRKLEKTAIARIWLWVQTFKVALYLNGVIHRIEDKMSFENDDLNHRRPLIVSLSFRIFSVQRVRKSSEFWKSLVPKHFLISEPNSNA